MEESKPKHRHRWRKPHSRAVWIAVIAAAAVFATATLLNQWRVDIRLSGPAEVQVEAGTGWTDPGAEADGYGSVYRFIRQDGLPVTVNGKADTDRLGTYTITYTAEYCGTEASVTRTVEVADTTPPVIHLTVNPDSYTEIGQTYEEEGYTAVDSFYGDLTDQVRREDRGSEIVYTVSDPSGNTAEVRRTVVYDDRTPPVITLEGGDPVLAVGSEFTDSYTASDNVDGDLTGQVVMEGAVDTWQPGTYTIRYTVTDSHGNTAEAQRTVSVTKLYDGKAVYLTFDDGPGPYTSRLLDLLAKYNAKATFFVTNQFPEYQDMISRETAEGHAVGVHTYSHRYQDIYASSTAFWDDFNRMEDVIAARTGSRTTLMRFPGGSSNTVSARYCPGIMTQLVSEAGSYGYHYFDWNVTSGDASGRSSEQEIKENVIRGIQDFQTPVILCHDIKESTVNAIEDVLEWGTKNGCTFAALDAGSYTAHHRVNN